MGWGGNGIGNEKYAKSSVANQRERERRKTGGKENFWREPISRLFLPPLKVCQSFLTGKITTLSPSKETAKVLLKSFFFFCFT